MAKELEDKSIEAIEKFLDWQVDMRMRERDYGPERYMEHVRLMQNQIRIDNALAMIKKYSVGAAWNEGMVESMRKILSGEE